MSVFAAGMIFAGYVVVIWQGGWIGVLAAVAHLAFMVAAARKL